jgi:hypothetical protein
MLAALANPFFIPGCYEYAIQIILLAVVTWI